LVTARLAIAPELTSLQNQSYHRPGASASGYFYNFALKGIVMNTGTVKWFNSTKGFGFIQPDNGGADAFVHISAVERSGMREIAEGQKLSYDLEQDRKSGKMSACNLRAV